MIIVSTYLELAAAISANEDLIIIDASFPIESTLTINYEVTIQGSASITLSRQSSFTGHMFNVGAQGNLTMQNIILEGNNIPGISLIRSNGILTINQATIQRGIADRAGAIYITGNTTTVNQSIISNCQANGQGASAIGGAIYTSSATLVITDTTIENNTAILNGGAIYLNQNSNLQTTNSNFINNTSTTNNGGAFFANVNTSNTVISSLFEGNVAQNGGAIFLNNNASLTLSLSSFIRNRSIVNGGAVYLNSNSTPSITQCLFDGNIAVNGGAMFINFQNDEAITNCSFVNNIATQAGGGIYCNNLTITSFTNCLFRGNQAIFGGAVYANLNSQVDFFNNRIEGNHASNQGGAIFVNNNAVVNLFNEQITDNSSGANGGGIYVNTNATLNIQDSSLNNNSAAAVGGAIYNVGTVNMSGTNQIGATTPNTAPTAPGIYNGGLLNVQDLLINPDGVYIPSLSNVVNLTGPLTPGSVIQLNTTDYVFPDPGRSPIVVGIPTIPYPILVGSDATSFIKPPVGFEDWSVRLINNQVVLVYSPSPPIPPEPPFPPIFPFPFAPGTRLTHCDIQRLKQQLRKKQRPCTNTPI